VAQTLLAVTVIVIMITIVMHDMLINVCTRTRTFPCHRYGQRSCSVSALRSKGTASVKALPSRALSEL